MVKVVVIEVIMVVLTKRESAYDGDNGNSGSLFPLRLMETNPFTPFVVMKDGCGGGEGGSGRCDSGVDSGK
ncbi:hypothetical protein E2C01_073453 [Portunus trituberculatus]|uniref:Uncharacterized protein n=1 Tax=Portunus trituberculatus TaxID=210409 RepID=A0A5B7IDZ7_PORTR|nr:hypothetical protein [Portunus trituberculatus]